MTKKQKKMLWRIVITAVMIIALHFLPITGIAQLIAYLAAYAVIGYDILRKAGKGIANGQPFDENFLMALATLGAFFLAIWTKSGDYVEGIAVMLFYQIGELFQSYAVGKSRRNISALMDIRPDYANIETDGKLEQQHAADKHTQSGKRVFRGGGAHKQSAAQRHFRSDRTVEQQSRGKLLGEDQTQPYGKQPRRQRTGSALRYAGKKYVFFHGFSFLD